MQAASIEPSTSYGKYLSKSFSVRTHVADKRLAEAAAELFGLPLIGRIVTAPNLVPSPLDVLKVMKVNLASNDGVWIEPTLDLQLRAAGSKPKKFSGVALEEIAGIDKVPLDEAGWTISSMAFPKRAHLITPMLEMAAAQGIGSLKELFLLAGRKVTTKDGVDATIDFFLGPSPLGDSEKRAGFHPAAPVFQLTEHYGKRDFCLPLGDFRVVDEWVKTV